MKPRPPGCSRFVSGRIQIQRKVERPQARRKNPPAAERVGCVHPQAGCHVQDRSHRRCHRPIESRCSCCDGSSTRQVVAGNAGRGNPPSGGPRRPLPPRLWFPRRPPPWAKPANTLANVPSAPDSSHPFPPSPNRTRPGSAIGTPAAHPLGVIRRWRRNDRRSSCIHLRCWQDYQSMSHAAFLRPRFPVHR